MAGHPRSQQPLHSPHDDPSGVKLGSEMSVFEDLYRRWSPIVRSAARLYVLSEMDAEGISHRIFLRLLKRGPTAWTPDNPERFFRRAVRNEALAILRRNNREMGMTGQITYRLASAERLPDHEAELAELRHALNLALARLPPRCGAVMALVAFEGLSHSDIAERLGITLSAVEHQVARGRRKMRTDLRRWFASQD